MKERTALIGGVLVITGGLPAWGATTADDASVEERAAAFDRHYGYFGRHDVDEGKSIVHH